MAVWSRFRISYAFIFGNTPGTEMRFAEARTHQAHTRTHTHVHIAHARAHMHC